MDLDCNIGSRVGRTSLWFGDDADIRRADELWLFFDLISLQDFPWSLLVEATFRLPFTFRDLIRLTRMHCPERGVENNMVLRRYKTRRQTEHQCH